MQKLKFFEFFFVLDYVFVVLYVNFGATFSAGVAFARPVVFFPKDFGKYKFADFE